MAGRRVRRRQFLGAVGGLPSLGLTRYDIAPTPGVLWDTAVGAPAVPISVSKGNVVVSASDGMFAFATDDGTREWTYETDGRPSVWDTTDDITILRGPSDQLSAVDLATGTELWKSELGRNPVLDSNSIRVVVEDDSKLLGLSAIDGGVRWEYAVDSSTGFHLIGRDTSFVGLSSGEVHAIATRDGARRWTVELLASDSGDSSGHVDVVGRSDTPSEQPDVIYAWEGGKNRLYALSADSGTRLWHATATHEYFLFPGTITDDAVYFLDGARVSSLRPVTGTKRWEFQPNGDVEFHPSVCEEVMYLNAAETTYALSTADGSIDWTREIVDDSVVTRAETGDVLSYRGDPGELYSLQDDGSIRWVRDFDGVLTRVEASDAGELFVGTEPGRVFALAEPPNTLLNATRQTTTEHAWELATVGLLSGSVLAGTYLLGRSGGRGERDGTLPNSFDDFERRKRVHTNGALEIYEATPPSNDRDDVILERIDVDASENDEYEERFLTAIETWEHDDRNGTVPPVASGTTPEPWVAFEAPGENLVAVGSELSVEEAVEVVSSVIEIVREDSSDGSPYHCLSPESIYVTENCRSASLANVGVAAFVDDVNPDPSVYAPPEQVAFAREKSTETMVYRLGSITYWLLTGRDPYDGTVTTNEDEYCPGPPSRVARNLPEELDDVVRTAVAYRPGDRFDSLLEFRDALRWAALVS